MWQVPQNKLNVELPPGFRIMEEEDVVHLFYGNEKVASFSSIGVDPGEIEKAAKEYLTGKAK